MAFWNKSEPSGINTNPELEDRTRYAPIPFVVALPQLSRIFYEALARNASTRQPFFQWNVQPGDRAAVRSIVGQFNLKSRAILVLTDIGEIMMPANGIITEISNNQESKYLFTYQPLLPLTQAENYRHMSIEQAEQSLRLCPVPLPYGLLVQKVFMALRYDMKSNELDSHENVNRIINSEIEKMGYAKIIPVLGR